MPLAIRGLRYSYLTDFYYFLLISRWPVLLLVFAFFYLFSNALFAALYLLGGDCILNAEPGSWWDAFFFSVQTWATIGYGAMAPKTPYADVLVAIESFSGLMSMSVVTGIVFSKFARPRSRVRFTKNILISRFDGVPVLMFRLGNMRGNQIVEARIRVVYASESLTKEGQVFRRLVDLPLLRESNVLFSLTWQVMHVIDKDSPFFGCTDQDFAEKKVQIIVSMSGTDEEFSQTVHARKSYLPSDIKIGYRFQDVLSNEPGTRVIDYQKFDDLVALP